MAEQITSIAAAISAILGSIITIYKLILKNEEKRIKTYYEELLKPFVNAYHKNKNINIIKYLNKKAKRNNDAIPKYIFYQLDKKESENLKKILLYDYSCIYPNDANKIMKFVEMFEKTLYLILFVSSFTLFIFATICLSFTLILFILYLFGSNIAFLDLLWLSIACFTLSIIIIQIYKVMDIDMYTLKECRIQKLINRKIKSYNKNSDKYIL